MSWASAIKRAPVEAPVARATFPPAAVDWSKLVTLDFESYFDADYTLKKLTTSEYVRDPRFKAQMLAIKVGNKPTKVVPPERIAAELARIDWSTHSALCHHSQFDGFILQYHYGVIPKHYYCTLSMARGWLANDIGAGLDEVAQHLGVGHKVPDVLNMTRGVLHWPRELYKLAAEYAAMDVELCLGIFKDLLPNFPQSELDLIDATCQMFCCPVLRLDEARARKAMEAEIAAREALLLSVCPPIDSISDLPSPHRRELLKKIPEPTLRDLQIFAGAKEVGSSERFADLLRAEGVEPPQKLSKAWLDTLPAEREPDKQWSYAFAQSDLEFTALAEHEDQRVRDLVETRLAVKSNINVTRAGRLLSSGVGGRPVPVYYKYAGAHTWRFSGGDKQNFQNFTRGGELRLSIEAPSGHVLAVADSGQIEARVNAWLWEQWDLIEDFREGRDIYSLFATENIYHREITKADKKERHVGKTAILGLGFQMGAAKFKGTLARGAGGPAVFIDEILAKTIVNAYRRRYYKIVQGWAKCEQIIEDMMVGRTGSYKCISWEKETIWLPNGMRLKYPNLKYNREGDKVYTRKGAEIKLYGGILCENLVQALARIIVAADQLLKISERYPVVMTTHDEVVTCVPEAQGQPAYNFMHKVMTTPPQWCADIPLSAEGGFARNYSK